MNPLWLIAIVLLVLFLQDILYERYIFRGLNIKRKFSRLSAFPGEELLMELELVNRKLLPITWLHMEQRFPLIIELGSKEMVQYPNRAEAAHRSYMSILPYQKVKRTYHIKCLQRGFFDLKEIFLESTNLFGTKKYMLEKAAAAQLTIYPRLPDVRSSLIPANSMQGDILVRRWIIEDPLMISGAREYVTSDDFRSINWKATAKHGKLKVNKYDFTADKKIMLLFNMDACGDLWKGFEPAVIESSIEVCASVAAELVKDGIPVGLATNAICAGNMTFGNMEPGTGEKHLSDILEMLARIQYYCRFKFIELLENVMGSISWGTELVIVTPYFDASIKESLYKVQGVKITVVALERKDSGELPSNVELFIYDRAGEQNEAV